MSVRMTTDGNITKIEIENSDDQEFSKVIKQFDSDHPIPYENYDKDEGDVKFYKINWTVLMTTPDGEDERFDTKRVIYVISTDYSFYTVENNEKGLSVNRRTYHDLNNPYTNKDFWESIMHKSNAVRSDERVKLYHIDDLYFRINAATKDYTICNVKHDLTGSTFFGITFFSCAPEKSYMEANDEEILLKLVQQLIEEMCAMPNIDSVLDTSLFDAIPGSQNVR